MLVLKQLYNKEKYKRKFSVPGEDVKHEGKINI
jgi:hypothetical protein